MLTEAGRRPDFSGAHRRRRRSATLRGDVLLRRVFLFVPCLAAASAALALVSPLSVLSVVIAALSGLAVAAWLSTAIDARLDEIREQIRGFARGAPIPPMTGGSPAWQRLRADLSDVGQTLRDRYAELSDERARVQRLLDSLTTAILLFDESGLAYANPSGKTLFRADLQQARTPLQVLGDESLADAVAEVRETGRSIDLEVPHDERHLVAHATLTGEGVVALAVHDVTEARRLEAVRRDFVTNASHELKTPVAGMQALAESLALAIERDPERARSMIGRLEGEASRLATLVRELLDLARLEENLAAQTGWQRVDFAEVVRAQAERLAVLAAQREVTINVDAAGSAPMVAFPGDLRLIAGNLLENAVLYNRSGGRVDARIHRRAGEVVLEVQDTGIGISEADQDRVFERFYRVDKARSRAVGGTGLGLSIVRHAVERHGGEVGVRSVLGEGTSFRIVLPVEGARSRD